MTAIDINIKTRATGNIKSLHLPNVCQANLHRRQYFCLTKTTAKISNQGLDCVNF